MRDSSCFHITLKPHNGCPVCAEEVHTIIYHYGGVWRGQTSNQTQFFSPYSLLVLIGNGALDVRIVSITPSNNSTMFYDTKYEIINEFSYNVYHACHLTCSKKSKSASRPHSECCTPTHEVAFRALASPHLLLRSLWYCGQVREKEFWSLSASARC